MKRRSFLKGVAMAGASTLLPSGVAGAALSACSPSGRGVSDGKEGGWDFDEVIDRTGTWSIKYGWATDGEIPMWIADMDFRTDPYVNTALRRRLERDVMGYTSVPPDFYDAVAGWEKRTHGYEVERDWIGYAPGVITSINQAYLTFTEPGDRIVVQPPVYDHFRLYIERLGRVAVDNPMIFEDGKYQMDFDGLERLLDGRTKALVLCNPHNPCGILWDRETLVRLADICERHGVVVISDEIHGDLALYGKRHTPFCSVSEAAARVGMIFAGPTKAFNLAGLSGTAYCIIPDREKRERFLATLRNAKLDEPSLMTIEAVIAAYREDREWLDALEMYIEGNISKVERFFEENDLGITAIRPQASFLVWLDCRSMGLPQNELMAFFKEKAKVIPSDGSSYGSGGEGFVRLNVGCPASVLEEALERIKRAAM